ncbi:MAG: hypothetical protein JXR76_10305 [Deltaproteobacteria bacterium]|nr:hypothetical protein [Deltaproteobacteria bacterium]
MKNLFVAVFLLLFAACDDGGNNEKVKGDNFVAEPGSVNEYALSLPGDNIDANLVGKWRSPCEECDNVEIVWTFRENGEAILDIGDYLGSGKSRHYPGRWSAIDGWLRTALWYNGGDGDTPGVVARESNYMIFGDTLYNAGFLIRQSGTGNKGTWYAHAWRVDNYWNRDLGAGEGTFTLNDDGTYEYSYSKVFETIGEPPFNFELELLPQVTDDGEIEVVSNTELKLISNKDDFDSLHTLCFVADGELVQIDPDGGCDSLDIKGSVYTRVE